MVKEITNMLSSNLINFIYDWVEARNNIQQSWYLQYNSIEILSTWYFYIQTFINIVQERNISNIYKLIEAFTANKYFK